MKRTLPFFLVTLLMSNLLLNCTYKHVCTSPSPVLHFGNFDSTSLNAVVVKRYNNNSEFNQPQRTTVYTSMVINNTNMPGADTEQLTSAGIILEYSTDYIIEVPAANRTWKIRNVSMQIAKMAESSCTSGLKYYLNDTLYTIPAVANVANLPTVINLNR